MNRRALRAKFRGLRSSLTERSRRLWAATEARSLGHGGVAAVEQATGISRSTIQRGLRELESGAHTTLSPDQTRRPGGGRKPAVWKDPSLVANLNALIEPAALGDPSSPLRWTSKSLRHLASALSAQGHPVSHTVVGELLHELGYSLQAIGRHGKVGNTWTATHSFATSPTKRGGSNGKSSR